MRRFLAAAVSSFAVIPTYGTIRLFAGFDPFYPDWFVAAVGMVVAFFSTLLVGVPLDRFLRSISSTRAVYYVGVGLLAPLIVVFGLVALRIILLTEAMLLAAEMAIIGGVVGLTFWSFLYWRRSV